MQFQTYLSILIALTGIASSAPTPADDAALMDIKSPMTRNLGKTIKKSIVSGGRFKPVWVIGYDEDEDKGDHIGFRLFDDGRDDDESRHMKAHSDHRNGHYKGASGDDHESSFWYYY